MKPRKKSTPPVSQKSKVAGEKKLTLEKRFKAQVLQNRRKAGEIDLLRAMINVLPDVHIFLKDHDSRFIIANRFTLKLLGLRTLADVIGRNDFDLFPEETAEKFFRDEQKIIETGRPIINREECAIAADRKEHWLLTTKVPLYFYKGKFSGVPEKGGKRGGTKNIAGIVGLSRDITALKNLEKEREKLIAELQQAIDKIKTLHGLIPICCSCKKIRDDTGYWQQIEMYMHDHADAEFSHGYCPECSKKALEEIGISDNDRSRT